MAAKKKPNECGHCYSEYRVTGEDLDILRVAAEMLSTVRRKMGADVRRTMADALRIIAHKAQLTVVACSIPVSRELYAATKPPYEQSKANAATAKRKRTGAK